MDVVTQLALVNRHIEAAETASGRTAGDVQLVAVSKTYDGDAIWPTIEAGQRVFGENRVQEAMGKWPALREKLTDGTVELHLIGPLQSNKVNDAVATFDVIESVDRDKIAAALAKEMEKQGRSLPCFIQVNTGNEPQKAGITPAQTPAFIARCRDVHRLNVVGLMCIPPFDEDPSDHFETLNALADAAGLSMRSMGMSGDYEAAIAAGATHVRVGSAIFGARPPIT
ncbi:MAG: YggS family pyridoxal phosphate-dependent enzyme [Hyphomicrobiales bacterium]